MSPSKPVYFTTPDGVKRELRFTFGARKRIVDRFGMHMLEALNKYDVAALPDILYCLMYDQQGNPPLGFDLASFVESDQFEDAPGLMATVMEAAARGRMEEKEKNALEALIREKMRTEMERLTGTISGPSPISASTAVEPTSGNSQNGNSTPSVNDTENSESLTTTAPV